MALSISYNRGSRDHRDHSGDSVGRMEISPPVNTAVIIQARMGSKRFPGKVLAPLAGKPVLQHVIERAKQIGLPVIVTMPYGEENEPIGLLCGELEVGCWDGDEDDVISRYLGVVMHHAIDIIIRITADCPLIDPELCKKVLNLYHSGDCDYAAIAEGKTFPKGYGCEVFSKMTLRRTSREATDPYDREHVTPWMERNLRCKYLTQDKDESHLNYCVDYPHDIERLERVLDARAQIT